MNWLTKVSNLLTGKKGFDTLPILSPLSRVSPLVSLTGSASLARQSPTASTAANWVSRNITEPALIAEILKAGEWDVLSDSPVLDAMLTPVYRQRENGLQIDQTPGQRLSSSAVDLLFYGNAYWLKIRNQSGKIVAFEWIPANSVKPMSMRGIGSWIDWYSISTASRTTHRVDPADMVHIRSAVPDPAFPSCGLAPINAIGDDLARDALCSSYMLRMLGKGGMGVIGHPEETLDGEIVQRINDQIKESMALNKTFQMIDAKVKLEKLGYSPEQMVLDVMITSAQSAICAAIGVMPQTLGVQAGEKTSTYSNVEQANKQSAMNCLGPMWDAISDAVTYQALEIPGQRIRFKWDSIQALQESTNDKWARGGNAYKAGVIDRAQAKSYLNYEPVEGDTGWYAYMERLPQPFDVALPSEQAKRMEEIERAL